MALMDEFKEEREQIKNAPFKKRLEYFWDYNKVRVIIAASLVVMFTSIFYHIITQKDTVLYVAMVDCLQEDTLAAEYEANLTEVLGVNTKKEKVLLDASFLVSSSSSMGDTSLTDALAVRIATGEIDAFLSGEAFFSAYTLSDVFMDLRTVLSPEDIAYYESSFYYLDYAIIESAFANDSSANQDEDLATYLLEVQPRNPETMKNPIPVGIYVTPTDEFQAAYKFTPNEDIVFGVIYNHYDIENIITFLDRMTGRDA